MKRIVMVALFCAFIAACTPDQGGGLGTPRAAPSSATSAPARRDGLPGAVAATRDGILAAAADHDYQGLRDWLDPSAFLSDFGFGTDPIDRWAGQGNAPIETMKVLLGMRHEASKSNEGRLFRWPIYDAETKSLAAISARDREAFLSVMTRAEFRRLVPNEEYGYVGPRLGILADGTWWFFIQEPEP